jgi:predicted TIM-barrel fold metal-dependent hydrolase
VETCIELFGPSRCMFESDPRINAGYRLKCFWNAFKRLASNYSTSEKVDLFAGTAIRSYRLPASLVAVA